MKKQLLILSLLPAMALAQTAPTFPALNREERIAQDLGLTDKVDTLSLTLDEALRIALADNPTIKVADQDIQLKRIADKDAWQALLPSADFTGTGTYTIKAATMKLDSRSFKMGSDNTSTYLGALGISLPVFAPAVYRTMQMTKTDIELAVEKGRGSRLDLVNQVTKAYYQLMLTQDTYSQLMVNYQQTVRNYNIVRAKYQQGRVSEYDKLSAEVQMRNAWPGVVSAQNAIRLAMLQLKVLMGVTANVSFRIDDALEKYHGEVIPALQTAQNIFLDNNSTLRQFDYNAKLLNHSLDIAKTNFMPQLALKYSFQYQSLYNKNFEFWHYQWSPSSTVALTLVVPLYHASHFTRLKTIRIQQQQLAENRLNTERQLRMSAQSYLDNMTASAEQLESNKTAVTAARKELLITEKRYEVGRGTILELNSAQVALTQSMLTYTNSIYDFLVAKANLDFVCGTNDPLQDKR